MALSMHAVCVPQVLRTLDSITKIIDKAIAHCTAKKIDPAVAVPGSKLGIQRPRPARRRGRDCRPRGGAG